MKQMPMSSSRSPGFRSRACSRASIPAISIGGSSGITLSHRKGNRSEISRTTTGQAELMTGLRIPSRRR